MAPMAMPPMLPTPTAGNPPLMPPIMPAGGMVESPGGISGAPAVAIAVAGKLSKRSKSESSVAEGVQVMGPVSKSWELRSPMIAHKGAKLDAAERTHGVHQPAWRDALAH